MNTGVEAVETALKLARRWGYAVKGIPEDRAEIVVFENNFHGRTIAAVSASTTPEYRKGFGPFVPGFVAVAFGDAEALDRSDRAEHVRRSHRTDSRRRGRHRSSR